MAYSRWCTASSKDDCELVKATARSLVQIVALTVFFPAASGLAGTGEADEFSSTEIRRKIDEMLPVRSASGRFLIKSRDKIAGQTVSLWAEQTTAALERMLGLKLPFADDPLTIVVREGDEIPKIESGQNYVNERLIQALAVSNSEKLDPDAASETLCRLLLDRWAVAAQEPTERAKKPAAVPKWMVVGASENIVTERRGHNSEQAFARWQQGKLEPLAVFLEASSSTDSVPDKAYSSVLFGWHESIPEKHKRFLQAFQVVASNGVITMDSMVAYVPDCANVDELDEKWDGWIQKQKMMVYKPGETSQIQIGLLEAELLLYPGDSGIPKTGDLNRRFPLREILDMTEEEWIPAFCVAKSQTLQAIAIGRSKQFNEVVQAYRAFLDALKKGKKRDKLAKLLEEADAKFAELKIQVEKAKPGTEAAKEKDGKSQEKPAEDAKDAGR